MLHRTAAAATEMQAWRIDAPGPGDEPLDDLALTSRHPSRTEPCADAVARHREGQEHRLPLVLRDPVALGTEPLDRKLDELAG